MIVKILITNLGHLKKLRAIDPGFLEVEGGGGGGGGSCK